MKRELQAAALLLLLVFAAQRRQAARKRAPGPQGPGSTPGAPGSAREKWDPLSLKPRVAALIAKGDPKAMREFAALLRADGWAAEAAELEAAAAAAEARKGRTK
jgi:hypothetical protein